MWTTVNFAEIYNYIVFKKTTLKKDFVFVCATCVQVPTEDPLKLELQWL